MTGGKDGAVRLWDAETGKQLQVERGQAYIYSIAVSPDGRLLATGSGSNSLVLWNIEQAPALANNDPAKPVVDKPPVKPPAEPPSLVRFS